MTLNMDLCRRIAAAHKHPLVFATISGAHLYGFASPDSDYDLRGCHLLPARDILGLHPLEETLESGGIVEGVEIDLVTHDATKFFRMLLKKNGYVLEQLLSPLVVQTSPAHLELVALAPRLFTRFHAFHYLGFAETQWNLFRKEQPPRVKPLLYVYRVLLTGIHLMRTGRLEANLASLNLEYRVASVNELIARKAAGAEKERLADADLPLHEQQYAALVERLRREHEASPLPPASDAMNDLSDILVRLRLATI
jgi:predicted nucleotidyltransferase